MQRLRDGLVQATMSCSGLRLGRDSEGAAVPQRFLQAEVVIAAARMRRHGCCQVLAALVVRWGLAACSTCSTGALRRRCEQQQCGGLASAFTAADVSAKKLPVPGGALAYLPYESL